MNSLKKIIKNNLLLIAALLFSIGAGIFDFNIGKNILINFLNTCRSTIPILLLMFALLAFIKVGMDSKAVQEAIQNNKGIKSVILGYVFGLLVSGPIYPGYSLSKVLLEHGIKIRVAIIMLSTWATLKIALLPFEIKILGVNITIIRWVVTGVAIFIIAISCEFIINCICSKTNSIKKESIVKKEA